MPTLLMMTNSAAPAPFASKGLRFRVLLGMAFVVCACLLSACRAPSHPPSSSLNVIAASTPSMTGALQEGDVIQIAFATSTNLNSTQRIQLDGQISLQFVGNVKAAGKTPAELQKSLEKLYEPQLRGVEPITVTVISTSAAVYVTGAVLRPGKIAMEKPLTVLEAIMEAGGADGSRAKLSAVTVLRVEDGKRISRRFDLKRALEGKDLSLFYLKPGDTVYIPEKVVNF